MKTTFHLSSEVPLFSQRISASRWKVGTLWKLGPRRLTFFLQGLKSLDIHTFMYISLSLPLTFPFLHFFAQRHKLECLSRYVWLDSTPADHPSHTAPSLAEHVLFWEAAENEWMNDLVCLLKGTQTNWKVWGGAGSAGLQFQRQKQTRVQSAPFKWNSNSETERNTPVTPKWFQPRQCCCCLCYPGEYLRLGTLISYNWTQVLEACDCLNLLYIYFDLCVYATG